MTRPTRRELGKRADALEDAAEDRDTDEEDLTARERIARACRRGNTGESDTLGEAIKKATGDVDRLEHHGTRSLR